MKTADVRLISAANPVLMSSSFARDLGLIDRATDITERECVVRMTEQELLDLGASRVEWGEPDALGRYTPMLYSENRLQVIP